jgi:cytoskeletal protein CcmA (bactofilin family)
MSLWKDNTATAQPTPMPIPEAKEPARYEAAPKPAAVHHSPAPTPVARADTGVSRKESLIAADITIEGKIEGGGSVRIAGKFKGDVSVQGDLTIETGAKLTGAVHAATVTVAGELEGSVAKASRIDLLQTAVVIGDLKADTLTVAAGARMRGQAEFGWGDGKGVPSFKSNGHGSEGGGGS